VQRKIAGFVGGETGVRPKPINVVPSVHGSRCFERTAVSSNPSLPRRRSGHCESPDGPMLIATSALR
jgi:hypothetical protein